MTVIRTAGVDPGLVHTGMIRVDFTTNSKMVHVWSVAASGTNVIDVSNFTHAAKENTWIEGYRPRSHFAQDKRLVEFIADLKKRMPKATVLDNMGVKKVVTTELMKVLNLWTFNKATHHQDIRSAARIMLFGMLKDEELNKLLSDIVRDHLNGVPWEINHY